MSSLKEEIMGFVDAITPYIQKIVRNETKNCIRCGMAIVVSADNDAHTAVVQQIYSDTTMTLRNCTGKNLSANDSVIIMWFGNQTNAWIGIKNDGQAWNV